MDKQERRFGYFLTRKKYLACVATNRIRLGHRASDTKIAIINTTVTETCTT